MYAMEMGNDDNDEEEMEWNGFIPTFFFIFKTPECEQMRNNYGRQRPPSKKQKNMAEYKNGALYICVYMEILTMIQYTISIYSRILWAVPYWNVAAQKSWLFSKWSHILLSLYSIDIFIFVYSFIYVCLCVCSVIYFIYSRHIFATIY